MTYGYQIQRSTKCFAKIKALFNEVTLKFAQESNSWTIKINTNLKEGCYHISIYSIEDISYYTTTINWWT